MRSCIYCIQKYTNSIHKCDVEEKLSHLVIYYSESGQCIPKYVHQLVDAPSEAVFSLGAGNK